MWNWKGRTGENACGVGTLDFEARKGDEDTPSEGFDYPGWRESVTARPIFVTNHMRPCRKSGAYREDWGWILAPSVSEGEISLAHLVTKYVCTQKQTSVPYILYRHLLASLRANWIFLADNQCQLLASIQLPHNYQWRSVLHVKKQSQWIVVAQQNLRNYLTVT